jgi:hypothetical protein
MDMQMLAANADVALAGNSGGEAMRNETAQTETERNEADRYEASRAEGDVQRIFGYPGGCIQSSPMRLGLVQIDIHSRTTSIQLNPQLVKSIYTLDNPNPLPGLDAIYILLGVLYLKSSFRSTLDFRP